MRKGHFHFHLTVPLANEVRMEGSATMSYICREVQTGLRQASRRHPIYLLIKPSPPPPPPLGGGLRIFYCLEMVLDF